MKRWLVPILVVLIVAAGTGGFFGGRASVSGGTTQSGPQALGTNGDRPNFGGANSMGGFTSGTILSKDESSITIQLSDGNSQTVYLSDSTEISETKDATIDALTTGQEVTVVGSTNTDNSVTASSIVIGSGGFGGMPAGGTPPAGSGGTPPSGMPSGGTGMPAGGNTSTTAAQ